MKVSVDFEIRSPVDIRTRGAYPYFEHPRTDVLMAAYRIDGGDLKLWTFLDDTPLPRQALRYRKLHSGTSCARMSRLQHA